MKTATDKIIKLREKMTISEIAHIIGTSENQIMRWCSGKHKMSRAWVIVVEQKLKA